jgi:hypothetical protein
VRPASSPAVRVPSILLAPPPAVMPRLAAAMAAQLVLELLAHVPVLVHVRALAHPVPVVRPVRVAQRLLVKRLVRSAPPQEAVADVHSIPRRRKAQ